MTCQGIEGGELLDGHIVALSRGSQLRVRLQDGREIRAIPELEALKAAECPSALIYNRPVQVRRSCTSNLRLIRQPDRPGTIPSLLYLYEGLLPWSPISFSTSWCSSPWCGCVSCSSGCGQVPPLPRA